jgi:hypothetical protein
MFPHANHSPAAVSKRSRYKPIASLIAGEFLFPEIPIVFGCIGMVRAAMPETAIHKNNHALLPKSKIRFADEI